MTTTGKEDAVTSEATIDMDARYSVAGYGGIAWYCIGPAKEWTEEEWVYRGAGDEDDESSYLYNEPEEIDRAGWVRMVMVGDDRVLEVEEDALTEIGNLDYCAECGQIGCCGDFRDREEN